jgi:hypothetical protein
VAAMYAAARERRASQLARHAHCAVQYMLIRLGVTVLGLNHLLWIGSITFVDWLHAKAKRVVALYSSMVRLRACWAAVVMLRRWAGQGRAGQVKSLLS